MLKTVCCSCPVNDRKGQGLSRIHRWKLGPTKVSFHLGKYLLFADIGHTQLIHVHCAVIACLQSYTKALLNIPKVSSFGTNACLDELSLSFSVPCRITARATRGSRIPCPNI